MRPVKPVVLVAVGLALGAVIAALLIAFPTLPPEASKQAERTDLLYKYMLALCGLIFGLVTVVLVYIVIHFKAKRGEEHDGPPIHGVTWLEAVWTAIPALVVISIVIFSWKTLDDNEAALAKSRSSEAVHVHILGQTYSWIYTYEDSTAKFVSPELVLPIDKPVVFDIETKDVIHSFWVPAWRVQINATPGQVNRLTATPTKTGSFELVCAFLCGPGHAGMNSSVSSAVKPVRVVTAAEYATWFAQQEQDAEKAAAASTADTTATAATTAAAS